MSTLGSATCARALLFYPFSGGWRADGVLDGGAVPTPGPGQTLTIGDLPVVGTVIRPALDAPDKPHFVMLGGAGWDTPMPSAPTYQQDAGVRLSTVLTDLATLTRSTPTDPTTGETFELLTPDIAIGTAYAAPMPRAGQVLRVRDALAALVRAGYVQPWRVDPDGVTRFGPRSGVLVPAATRQTLIQRDAGVGVALLGVDAPSAFLPGNTCSALDGATIRRLVVTETAGKLEAEVWGSTGASSAPSVRNAVRRMVREDFPEMIYGFPRTYIVTAVRGDGRLDLAPPADAPELPVLPAVDQWLDGIQLTPNVGDQVVVSFRDANPTRPMVTSDMPLRSSTPAAVKIDATGTVSVGTSATDVNLGSPSFVATPVTAPGHFVRYGDPVTVGTTSGLLLLPSGATISTAKG